jgi:hypothetical protein
MCLLCKIVDNYLPNNQNFQNIIGIKYFTYNLDGHLNAIRNMVKKVAGKC